MYGGISGAKLPPPKEAGLNFVPFPLPNVSRRRLNGLAIVQCILLPWGLFAGILWLISYWVHFYHPTQTLFLAACALLAVLFVIAKAVILRRLRDAELEAAYGFTNDHSPTWVAFLAATCGLAWLLGVGIGEYNFVANTSLYYGSHDLATVNDVDPRAASGAAYMDASALLFSNGSYVDQLKSLSFKDGTVYCVAPITRGTAPLAQYEFWAAGTDCCDPFGGKFWCGGVINSDTARAGLRIMEDDLRVGYRRAAQQAEAEYNLHASHPMFFTWSEDPSTSEGSESAGHPSQYKARADRLFKKALVVSLVLQTVAVFSVVRQHSKFSLLS